MALVTHICGITEQVLKQLTPSLTLGIQLRETRFVQHQVIDMCSLYGYLVDIIWMSCDIHRTSRNPMVTSNGHPTDIILMCVMCEVHKMNV
jgi:hypothetical protein